MEGASSFDSFMILERLHGFEDLQGPMQLHHHQDPHFYQHGSMVQQQIESAPFLNVQSMQVQPISVTDCNINERGQSFVSDDYLRNFSVAGINEHNEVGKGTEKPWQRIKWTEQMVKLLITAVSYIRHYASVVGSGSQESSVLQKIGKWRLVSNAMVERGFHVSPQQCEDKFNNLNKSYKRLNEVLGRGFSCKVVENPKLLDEIGISEKEREEVRKILCSKQLFYEEMCSYHNGNQLYLPHDPDLQRCLQLALKKKGQSESRPRCSKANNDFDERVEDAGADGRANETEDIGGISGFQEVSVRKDAEVVNPLNFVGSNGLDKQYQDNETLDIDAVLGVSEVSGQRLEKVNRDIEAVHPLEFVGIDGTSQDHQQQSRIDISPKRNDIDELQKKWMAFRSCRIRVQRLHIKAQMLKLEKQRLKWQRICWKRDREMKKMRRENETLKIENEQMEMELEFKRLRAEYSLDISM